VNVHKTRQVVVPGTPAGNGVVVRDSHGIELADLQALLPVPLVEESR